MNRIVAAAVLLLTTASTGWPAAAETGVPAPNPAAEPRSYVAPTDESEPAPRTPPVTHPKPMERTRMGVPVEPETSNRAAPAERADPPPKFTAPTTRAAAPRRTAQRRAPAPRYTARTPQQPDTSLSTIFTRPRTHTEGPPAALAPQAGPSAERPDTARPLTFNYAAVPPAPSEDALCPTRSRASLGELFACTR